MGTVCMRSSERVAAAVAIVAAMMVAILLHKQGALLVVAMARVKLLLDSRVGTFSSLVLVVECLIAIMLILNRISANLRLLVKWLRLLETSLELSIILCWRLKWLRLCCGNERGEFRRCL